MPTPSDDALDLVRRLTPDVLHQVVRHHGLDACGALIASATPEQVTSLLDIDLWRTTPRRSDRFDEQRFGAWLEMLMEEGESVAARIIAAMDTGLAITGLSRFVRVFDPGVTIPLGSGEEQNIGGYVVRARTPHSWDAIVGLLATLAQERPAAFHDLMRGCRELSNSTPESDGLDSLLLAAEQRAFDVSVQREQRRSKLGYLSTEDARALLKAARQPRKGRGKNQSPLNAIADAYFKALDEGASPASVVAPDKQLGPPAQELTAARELPAASGVSVETVLALLVDAGVAPARPKTLSGAVAAEKAPVMPLQPLMEHLYDAQPAAYFARTRELAFLANALLAGAFVDDRALTPQEASDAAVGICNLALEAAEQAGPLPAAYLVDNDLLVAFETGWKLLHAEVSLFVADRLIAALAEPFDVDTECQRDLHRLRREMKRQRTAGMPWLVRDALEVIAILDTPTWACLRALLAECPVLPAALPAMLDRLPGAVSPSAFACFSSREQILLVHQFCDRLPQFLAGT